MKQVTKLISFILVTDNIVDTKMKKKLIILMLITVSYLSSLFIFFLSDDWFHLRVSQITNLQQFLNFFSFSKTAQSIAFYRPLPTQVFFFVFQKLFGLNPLPYHIFVLACFAFSLTLVYRLAKFIFKSDKSAWLTMIIYGFSVSNFTRLYFLSAFQEIALVIFSLLTIINYLEGKKNKSLIFFVLALLSKETAVVLPLILFFLDWAKEKINLKKIIPYALILIPYLYLRLFHFGGVVGDSYIWNLSPLKAVNTLMWYVLWSIGAPELLVDYVGSGLRPIPRFFTDYPVWWMVILGLLIPTILFLGYLFVKNYKKINKLFLSVIILFVLSLGPVLFLPQHKFSLELGLPLVWFSLAVAWLLPQKGKITLGFLILYLALNFSMNYLTYTRHYSVGSAKISQRIFAYFSEHYQTEPKNSYFEFINDTGDYGAAWGSSKQISNAVGGSELFRVLYHDPSYSVYYQDFPGDRPNEKSKIMISTKAFYQ